MKGWIYALIGLLMLSAACESQESQDRYDARQNAEWKYTKEGVRYYETCIEGKTFYVAWRRMSGPVGDCES